MSELTGMRLSGIEKREQNCFSKQSVFKKVSSLTYMVLGALACLMITGVKNGPSAAISAKILTGVKVFAGTAAMGAVVVAAICTWIVAEMTCAVVTKGLFGKTASLREVLNAVFFGRK